MNKIISSLLLALCCSVSQAADGSLDRWDVLFVLDNSGSMETHKLELAMSLDGMLNAFQGQADLNAAVITGDVISGPVASNSELGPINGTFAGPVLNNKSTSFVNDLYEELITQRSGNNGETFFDAIQLSLSPQINPAQNSHFLRKEAGLLIVVLTDSEDQSSLSVYQLYAELRKIKPPHQIKTLALMASSDKSKACGGEDYALEHYSGIRDLVKLTRGQTVSLCGDFAVEIPKAIKALKL